MATPMEDMAMMRAAEQVEDELWKCVTAWNEFARDTIGKQLVRAVDSIGANIAESYGRYNFGEKIQFLYYARGSLFETKFWLNRAAERHLLTHADHERYAEALVNIGRQINNFVNYLRTQRSGTSGRSKTVREEAAAYEVRWPTDDPKIVLSDQDLEQLSRL